MIVMLILTLVASDLAQGRPHEYVSAGNSRLLNGAPERIQEREQEVHPALALALGTFAVTAAFTYFFIKFDRKQNTRLWPFVTAGTTRSPPSSL
jgi:hypothetical protein